MTPAEPGRVAVVLKGYPRLSETFVAQELSGLERRGLDLLLISLRRPTDPAVHDLHRAIRAPVAYLPEYLHEEPRRVLRGWARARRLPGFRAALRLWLRDLRRDPTRNRVRRFGQALVLAAELPDDAALLYAHFLHTPASVARYAAAMRGRPFAVSAHAKDIWTIPAWEKREKLADARFVVTCTRAGADHLRALAPATAGKVGLLYHGLDPARFPPAGRRPGPDGRDPASPVRLLAVARCVPKKGLDLLLDACALLPPNLNWRLDHIGGGPEGPALAERAERLGLAARVTWHGARPHDAVLAAYGKAEIVVLPSRVAADGDRDGLPNVLMEALSQDCAVLATDAAAIPELIEDGAHGRLVPPERADLLAEALAALIADPATRLRLGRAGRERVLRDFAADANLDRLADLLGAPSRAAAAPSAA